MSSFEHRIAQVAGYGLGHVTYTVGQQAGLPPHAAFRLLTLVEQQGESAARTAARATIADRSATFSARYAAGIVLAAAEALDRLNARTLTAVAR